MKTPEQWANEVPEHFIGDRKDRALFAWLFEQAMDDARRAALDEVFAAIGKDLERGKAADKTGLNRAGVVVAGLPKRSSPRFFMEHGAWHDRKTGKHLHDIVTEKPASDRLGVLLDVLSGHDQTHDEAMAELEADGVDVDAFLDGIILAAQGPTP